MWSRRLLALAVLVSAVSCQPAYATEAKPPVPAMKPLGLRGLCAPLDELRAELLKQHQEEPTALGLSPQGGLVLFRTEDGRSWTLVRLMPDGSACLVAIGRNWRSVVGVRA